MNKDLIIQEMIFQGLIQGNRTALDKDSQLIMPGEVTASLFIDYAYRENKIIRDKVLSNLEILNIPETRLKKKILLNCILKKLTLRGIHNIFIKNDTHLLKYLYISKFRTIKVSEVNDHENGKCRI